MSLSKPLRWMLLFCASAAVLAGSVSHVAYADQIDDIVKSEMAQQHITGLALAVMKDGHIVRSGGYGLANVELNVPVTTKTVFEIGSISKQFIASAVMILVQQGKINLDDSVSKFIDDAPETWRNITIRRLLSHTGGLVREAPAFNALKVQPNIDIVRSVFPVALLFPPGAKWDYSNVGYFTLAEIISRVSGQPWPEFIRSHIFQVVGMTATRTTTASEIVLNRADGYQVKDGELNRAPEQLALRPSGAFLSTVEDMAKWDAALYTDVPLPQSTREQMWTPVALNDGTPTSYGFGWRLETRGGKRVVAHGGAEPGFLAYFARLRDDHLSFIVLTNSRPCEPDKVLWKIAAVWLPGVDQAPPKVQPK